MNQKPLFSKEYNISMEMFGNAFRDFQKKFSYPKNILMTCAFGIIGISYIPSFIKDPGNTVCVLIIIVCTFMAAGIWLNTAMIRKNLMRSIEGIQGDKYIVEIYENTMNISTLEFSDTEELIEESVVSEDIKDKSDEDDFFAEPEQISPAGIVKTVIDFVNDDVKILEKKDYYIIYLVKRMFYVVPKNIFSADETKLLTDNFRKAKFIEERK